MLMHENFGIVLLTCLQYIKTPFSLFKITPKLRHLNMNDYEINPLWAHLFVNFIKLIKY